jgi:dTDP-4-dehydrorhamnose 3,5-epimerase-like enzyme
MKPARLPLTSPIVIEGSLGIDDRGEVAFVNDFRLEGIKRFYMVMNYRSGFVRAWHAHRRESKYVTVVQGAAIVAAVSIDNWESPSKQAQIHRHVLSSRKPAVLCIPAGYANGFMTLTDDTKLCFFSSATVAESQEDDFRYDAKYWNPWGILER